MSTAEAELISLTQLTKEVKYLNHLLIDLNLREENEDWKIHVNCDNEAAIHIAKSDIITARTKHMEIRYCYVKEMIKRGDIELTFVSSQNNLEY